ncbi:FmdB family transcriptional regulator [Stutzerimonas stutzeri]|uniref:FmdB family transcriptional regulator n=1 Tax=Stutzerimonas stutzeri TaxID=316 RepID=A0A2N8T6L9_STUST|nr:zinc ribbon domain-containing protein [Stutzerimonas stutzeri]MCQ4323401.1 zinc ribbon domain-containing protein [Stutzerimonas stutzeri]PNG10388.1 FmdB family transcriptional regulator [Stutzerimonas stutzeri]
MPIYEYDCAACGDFTMLRLMADRDQPCACPACGGEARRVILSAPGLATMAGSQRRAIETNERSAHAPQSLAEYKANRKHGAGCSCCGPSKPNTPTKANPHGLKASPSARPWMISH